MKTIKIILYLFLFSSIAFGEMNQKGQGFDTLHPIRLNLSKSAEDSMVKQIKFALTIRSLIPNLFINSYFNELDFVNLAVEQEQIQSQLFLDFKFAKAWNQHIFYDITIEYEHLSLEKSEYSLSYEQVSNWVSEIQHALSPFLKPEAALNRVQHLLDLTNNESAEGILNGMILQLPEKKQNIAREFSRQKNENELIDFLERELPSTLPGFKSLNLKLFSKVEVLNYYIKILKTEEELNFLIDGLALYNQFFKGVNFSSFVAFYLIDDVGPQDLAFLWSNKNERQEIFYKIHLQKFKKLARRSEKSSTLNKQRLILIGQNPNWALARGQVGQDCATRYSFPFPNDPNEHVFYVYRNEEHLPIGYIQATIVSLENGKKGFYLHTISGPTFETQEALTILNTFIKSKAQLGVSQILVPELDKIEGLNNNGKVARAFKQISRGRKVVPIKYLNQNYRSIIEKFSSYHSNSDIDYEHVHPNKIGIAIDTIESELVAEVQLKRRTFMDKNFRLVDKINIGYFFELLLSRRSAERIPLIDVMSELSENERNTLKAFFRIYDNPEHYQYTTLKRAEELNKVLDFFDYEHLFLKENNFWFLNYLLNATDAKDQKYLAKNLNFIAEDLNRKTPFLSRKVLSHFMDEFSQDPKFEQIEKDVTRKLISANGNYLYRLIDDDPRIFVAFYRDIDSRISPSVLKKMIDLGILDRDELFRLLEKKMGQIKTIEDYKFVANTFQYIIFSETKEVHSALVKVITHKYELPEIKYQLMRVLETYYNIEDSRLIKELDEYRKSRRSIKNFIKLDFLNIIIKQYLRVRRQSIFDSCIDYLSEFLKK